MVQFHPGGPNIPRTSREKNAEYQHKWYLANKEKQYKKTKDREAKIKASINDMKANHGCSRCDENCPVCLDFHHVAGDKELTVSQARMKGWSLDRIKKEIEKCIILCSNCHRKEHWL